MSPRTFPYNSRKEQETSLIPRKILFGNPDKTSLQISHDGKYLSFLAPAEGVLNVWVAPTDDPKSARAVTHDVKRGIRSHSWSYTPNYLLYIQDEEGDENWQIHSLNISTLEEKNLTPFEEILGLDGKPLTFSNGKRMRPSAHILHRSPTFPDEILLGMNNRDPKYHDIFRSNIRTGELQLIQHNDSFIGFVADDYYNIRLGEHLTADGGKEILQRVDNNGWNSFMHIPMEDLLTSNSVGFDHTGEFLFMTDSQGRDKAALIRVDLKLGTTTILVEDPKADVSGFMIHPITKTIQAVSTNYLRVEWKVLDEAIQRDLEYLKSLSEGDLSVTSRSYEDRIWTVVFTGDSGPGDYYLYDRMAKKATFLFTDRQSIENLPMAKMHPVSITSRDGLSMVAYLTLPVWTDADLDVPHKNALPMVLVVHGGPWGRDSWGFNSIHQWLANRGYAVLSVNYRGSTGFGKTFINAANQEWAGRMHNDLVDAVHWAVKNRIANENRVAIMGASYGGYATLVGLTFTPDVFACGIDIVGPSNLRTLLETIPPYWQPLMDLWASRIGDPRTDEGRQFLESRSPLNKSDQIIKPLLIGQGANDPRVKQSESDQLVQAMQEKQIPVTYALYPDEGHGFVRLENRLSFFAVAELFLAEHLGGRSEAIGNDFENSSIDVRTGAGYISGLSESLQ